MSNDVQLGRIGNGNAGSIYPLQASSGPQRAGNDENGDFIRQDMIDSVDSVTPLDPCKYDHFPSAMQVQLEIDPLPTLAVVDQMGQLEHTPPEVFKL